MANNPTIVAASLSDQDLKNSIDKLVKHVEEATNKMAGSMDSAVERMKKKLGELGNVKIDFGGTSSSGGTKKVTNDQKTLEEQTKRTTQAVKEQNLTLDQQSSAQKNAVSIAKKYSEEVTKQAQAIREMKQFQEKGFAMVGDRIYYDPSKSVAPLKNRLSLEQQILNAQREEEVATIRRISAEKQEAIEKAAAAQAAQTQLVGEKQITQEIEKRSSKKNTFSTYDDLRQAIASVLGLQKQQIKVVDEEYASYNKLNSALTQYRQAFNALNASERNSENGKNLLRRIHDIEDAINRLQKEARRPISLKDALKGSENTLDAIARKIQRLQAYKGSIDFTKPDAADKIKQVDDKLRQLQNDADKWMGKQRGIIEGNNALGRSWNYMKNRLAFYFTVGASTQFVKSLIDVRGQYELLERSIGILIDSIQNGGKIFAELNAMAIKSPFTTMELGAAAKQLVAYDVSAKDVVDTTRRLADMAAAVGIPIERLTYALGQIKAYGYLNARDARMFANAGIPLVKELADRYTELEGRLVSTSDVYDRIKKKAISYEDVMETVNKMTDEGGKFFNFQEKAADTLKVKIANLTLAWNNMLNEIGKDNQGVLAGMLNITKQIFESWRDINNMLIAIAVNFGVIKATQIARLLLLQKEITWTRTLAILQTTLGKGAAGFVDALGKGVTALANPITLALTAVTALSVVITKLVLDYSDLQKANEAFNKSIIDGAEENIKSIDKFFEDYKKQLEGIGSASTIDQQKMWEKIQDEIEKTTKNAQQYVVELEKIQNIADRIDVGKKILEQEQEIEQEAKRLAERGVFDLGGGFADDSLADNLINYGKELQNIKHEYGDVTTAVQEHSFKSRKMMADYTTQLQESERELVNFASKLDNADITKIMGDDPSTQLANLREFSYIVRDSFLATERGQKITADGQARLNSALDKWVAKQAQANDLIKNQTVYAIEENRTAWETFFDQLNRKDRERLDYLIKTNQTGSEDFKEIWDKATKSMSERATTSYELIQSQIANLRNTPDIVINVVYRERTEKVTDKQIQAYKEKYLTPDTSVYTGVGQMAADAYAAEQERLTRKYGRYIKKEGEDNVEWEKRLGQEYQNNTQNIESLADQIKNLNKQKEKGIKISEIDIKAKEDEKAALEENNKTLLEIKDNEGFNYEQFKKGRSGGGSKKDIVLEALKQEISLVERLQGDYDKLTNSGASRDEALKTIRASFGKTIDSLNSKLSSAGLPELTTQLFIGKDPNKMLEHFKQTLNTLVSNGMMTLERSKEVEAVIEKLTVSAKTYNLDKITKGLNNELDRLKDEYELAVELDANPELGNMFADMFDIDLDTLPKTAKEYAEMYTDSLNKYFKEMGANIELPNMLNVTRDDMKAFTEQLGTGELQKFYFDLIQKGYEATHDAKKKEATDSIKEYQDLLQKYSEYQYKLTQITKQANNERKALVVQFGNEQQKEEARKIVKNLDVEKDQQKIEELNNQLSELIEQVAGDNELTVQLSLSIDNKEAKEKAKALWDNFKNSDSYTIMFDDLKRASTGALNQLGESFEEIKPKIKESPEAMKELMNAYKQLREELTARDPFGAMVTSMERMRKASANVEIAEKELDDANKTVKKNEDQLALLRKTEPKNIKAIEAAEKNLTKAKKDASEKQKNLTNAQNQQVAAKDDYKKALSESAKVIDKLGQSISSVGSQIEGTAGQVLQLIGDIMSFVKTVSDGIVSTSETASKALQAIETASVILMIISAAIKIVQQISELLSDSFGEYEKFAEKQAEINKLKDSVVEYQMAVLEARMEEENWFSTSNLKKLKNYYKIGSEAIDAYKDKLFQAQAVYENESGSGWLTKLGAQASKTIAGIVGGVNSLFGLEGTFIDDISTKLAQFGWANAAGGMIGMNMYLENLLWNKKYDKSYEEGLIAAWQNLRIETREASKGFLGTGIGGHSQETRDLIEWAREELGMELFLEDLTLNEEAYKVIMDKWADKLVGETKDTLEALHEYTEKWKEYIEQLEEYVDSLYSPLIDNMADAMWDWFDEGKNALDSFKEYSKKTFRDIVSDMMKTIMLSNFGNKYAEDISDLYTEYVKGGMNEKQLIEKVGVRTNELMDSFQRNIPVLEEVMNTASQVFKQYGIDLKEASEESSLSALQQGIQGVTEETAGAVESYLNIISQRIFIHTDLITEIRDAVVGMTGGDIGTGIQAQMLLQLQSSYQTQEAIRSILEGWSSANGMSVKVELVS